ncbi:MAG: uracil-DNA glycosylase family protein [Fidelibacterota bacterium]
MIFLVREFTITDLLRFNFQLFDMDKDQDIFHLTEKYLKEYGELYGDELLLDNTLVLSDRLPYSSLEEMCEAIKDCKRCVLGSTRTSFVFGVGDAHARMVLVGEAPGREEDLQGEPFVGRAGQLLNKILKALNLKREEVYIANVIKCRPPNNRDPFQDEIRECEPYLKLQLKLINPHVIIALGRVAAQSLLKINLSLAQMRGKVFKYQNIDLMVTYHPAALLRNPGLKRPCWEDWKLIRDKYLQR